MAELRQNTWTLNQWYDQDVAGDAKYAASGKLWAWGYNLYGHLGQNESGPTASYSSPVQIPGTDWITGQSALDRWNGGGPSSVSSVVIIKES